MNQTSDAQKKQENRKMSIASRLTDKVEWQEECRKLVGREVYYCVSTLVSDLAQEGKYLDELMPVLARENYIDAAWEHIRSQSELNKAEQDALISATEDEDYARNYCDENRTEPYITEAYEHWIVSDWLATKLEEHGEMVIRDFMGLTIWGRPTTGQAIYIDCVISEIALETLNEKEKVQRLIAELSPR